MIHAPFSVKMIRSQGLRRKAADIPDSSQGGHLCSRASPYQFVAAEKFHPLIAVLLLAPISESCAVNHVPINARKPGRVCQSPHKSPSRCICLLQFYRSQEEDDNSEHLGRYHSAPREGTVRNSG